MFEMIWHFLTTGPGGDCSLAFLPLLIGALAGLASGAGKYALGKDQEGRDRKVAAETQRFAPWTKLQAQPIRTPDLFGDLLQGGAAGAGLGQSYTQAIAPDPGKLADIGNQVYGPPTPGNLGAVAPQQVAGMPNAASMGPWGNLRRLRGMGQQYSPYGTIS